jgi:hypothetical protein
MRTVSGAEENGGKATVVAEHNCTKVVESENINQWKAASNGEERRRHR